MRKTRPSCARPLARHHVSLLHQQRRTGPGRRPVPGSRAEAPKQLTRPTVHVVQSVASFSSLLEGSLTSEGFPACPLKMTPSSVSSALRTPGPSLLLCNTHHLQKLGVNVREKGCTAQVQGCAVWGLPAFRSWLCP